MSPYSWVREGLTLERLQKDMRKMMIEEEHSNNKEELGEGGGAEGT